MIISLRNTTLSNIMVQGVGIAASSTRNVQDKFTPAQLLDDTDLSAKLTSGDLVGGDGTNEFSKADFDLYLGGALVSPNGTVYPQTVNNSGMSNLSGSLEIANVYAYNILADAGTFNSVPCDASTASVLHDRWYFRAFSSTNNASAACQVTTMLPESYDTSKDLKVEIKGSYNDGVGGDLVLGCGLTVDATNFGDNTDTTYQAGTNTLAADTNWVIWTKIFTFSNTLISSKEPIAIVVYRNVENGSGDTLGSTFYINNIRIYQEA